MKQQIEDSLETIDAAIFTGDTFQDKEDRDTLTAYLERWLAEIKFIELEYQESLKD